MFQLGELSCPRSINFTLFSITVTGDFIEQFVSEPQLDGIYEKVRNQSLRQLCPIVVRFIEIKEYLGINHDIEYVIRNICSKER